MSGAYELDAFQRSLFPFDRNTFVRASAGTGKTEALTGLYVHLVLGASALPEPISPARIVAMTFTEKATEEMRERIDGALRFLAGGGANAGDGDARAPISVLAVRESLRLQGKAVSVELARTALAQLADAPIHTIHGYAAKVVRAHADVLGIDLGGDVVDDHRAGGWLDECFVAAIDALVLEGDGVLRELLDESSTLFGLGGFIDALKPVLAAAREMGVEPGELWRASGFTEEALTARRRAAASVLGMGTGLELPRAWETFARAHSDVVRGASTREAKRRKEVEALARDARDDPRFGSEDIDALFAQVRAMESLMGSANVARDAEPLAVRTAVRELWALPRAAERVRAVVRVLERAAELYAARKRAERVLDFTDQLRMARDVLAAHPELRDEGNRSVGALLVDEFQDTNAIQRDLVYLLRARRGVGKGVPAAADLETTGLLVVGDPKQSIYGFRNADVAVFNAVERDLVATGARTLYLKSSRRSHGKLVEAMNALSASVLAGPASHPFELAFDAEHDALEPTVASPTSAPAVTVLEVPSGKDELLPEPELVARYLARTFAGPDVPQVRGANGALRPARFGDVAILLRRFTHVGEFTRALLAEGVPYTVVKGRGYFEAAEVQDALALAAVLLQADDDVAFVTLLRSPMLAASDRTLHALANALERRPWSSLLGGLGSLSALDVPRDELERMGVCLREIERGRRMAVRVGLGEAMAAVLRATDYLAVLAMLPSGDQRIENVERLVDEVLSRERAGDDARTVFDELLERAANGRDAESDDATHDDAVRLMTVHQSKGLQFPVVVAADLGAGARHGAGTVVFDREPGAGLAVLAARVDGDRIKCARHEHVEAVAKARDVAEARRNFYVQVTRARDHLVLSGVAQGRMKEVLEVANAHGALFEFADATNLAAPAPVSRALASAPAQVEDPVALVKRVVPLGPRPRSLHVSVTELEDHAVCPRRFRGHHVLRLPEVPTQFQEPDPASDLLDPADPRRRGTRIHALLEHVDYGALVADPVSALEAAARAARLELDDDARTRIVGLARTEFAKMLGGAATEREVPFSVRVPKDGVNVFVRGQIDLLVVGDEGVDIVDFKVTAPAKDGDISKYRFQLSAYARAVRVASPNLRVRAGIWFVHTEPSEPVFLDLDDADAFDVAASSLVRQATTGEVEGRDRAFCRAIACGYEWLCHGTMVPPGRNP